MCERDDPKDEGFPNSYNDVTFHTVPWCLMKGQPSMGAPHIS